MQILPAVLAGIAVLAVAALPLPLRIVQQYQEGVLFQLRTPSLTRRARPTPGGRD